MQILAGLIGPDLDIELTAVSEDDHLTRLEWLNHGEIDLMYEGYDTPAHFAGDRPGEITRARGPFPLRVVASAHSGLFGFMVSGDSPVRTIYDITPETRVAESSNSRLAVAALGHWLGFGPGSATDAPLPGAQPLNRIVYGTWQANVKSVVNREADVAYVSVEHPVVRQAADRPPGVRFLELPAKADPDGAARFHRAAPNMVLAPAPDDAPAQVAGLTTVLGSANLWCRSDFDAALAYRLTEWFDRNFDRFKGQGNKLGTYSLAALRYNIGRAMAPIHESTIRYLDKLGFWTEVEARRQEYNLRLLHFYYRAWREAVTRADAAGIVAGADNPAWYRLWQEIKAEIGLPVWRLRSDSEISDGLRGLKEVVQPRFKPVL